MCRAGHFDTLFGETMSQALEPKTVAKKARRGPTREDKVVERRLSLLEATLRVIARKGLIGVTMSDIASEAGCAYGVVAFHFKSKEGCQRRSKIRPHGGVKVGHLAAQAGNVGRA